MRRSTLFSLMLAALAAVSPAAAELGELSEGLHTWQIESTADVHACCYSSRRGKEAHGGCRIDARSLSFTSRGDCAAGPGAAQVYVRIAAGKPAGIWVLSSACPVTAASAIEDHGQVSAIDSVEWFRSVIENGRADRDVREQALFALVQTESDVAFSYLDRVLTDR